MRHRAVLLACALGALPALAEELRPAPDHFVQTAFATTTAQALALACPTLSFEILRAAQESGRVMGLLAQEGFDPERLSEQMIDPAPRFAELRAAFLEKHGLADGAPAEAVCAAGRAEIAEGSAIGGYLVEVGG